MLRRRVVGLSEKVIADEMILNELAQKKMPRKQVSIRNVNNEKRFTMERFLRQKRQSEIHGGFIDARPTNPLHR